MARIAEDLALMLLRDNGGWRCSGIDAADCLAGALLAELADEGFLNREADPSDIWSRQRVRSQSVEPPADPILAQVWESITDQKGAMAVQRRVAKESRDLVMDVLTRAETVSKTPRPILGPRYARLDDTRRDALRAELLPIVVDEAEPDDRQRSIIWLLNGAYCLRQSLGLAFRETVVVHRAIRRLGKPVWPEKSAIDAVTGRRAAAAS